MSRNTEVDVVIHARIDLAELGVSTVEELNVILDEAEDITVEVCTAVDEDKAFTLMGATVKEEL